MTSADEMIFRLSEAMDHLDQANTIFNYVLFALSDFGGFDDPEWNHKFEAMVNVSGLLGSPPGPGTDVIAEASREIAIRRLPRLLCIALVSAVETCLQDVARIRLGELHPGKSDDDIERDVRRLMGGGPLDYLPRMAERLQIPYFADDDWKRFVELAATRNVLVHQTEPIADERYVRTAGAAARVAAGKTLSVDNKYLVPCYGMTKMLMLNLIQIIQGKPGLV